MDEKGGTMKRKVIIFDDDLEQIRVLLQTSLYAGWRPVLATTAASSFDETAMLAGLVFFEKDDE